MAKRQRRPFCWDFATAKWRNSEVPKATVSLGLRHGEVEKSEKNFFAAAPPGGKKSFRAYIGSAFWARQEPTKTAPEKLCFSPACFFGGKERNCQCAGEKAPRRGKPPAPNDRPRPRPASPPGLVTKRRQRRPTFVAQTTPTVNLTFRPRGAKLNTRRGKPPRAPKRP